MMVIVCMKQEEDDNVVDDEDVVDNEDALL